MDENKNVNKEAKDRISFETSLSSCSMIPPTLLSLATTLTLNGGRTAIGAIERMQGDRCVHTNWEEQPNYVLGTINARRADWY